MLPAMSNAMWCYGYFLAGAEGSSGASANLKLSQTAGYAQCTLVILGTILLLIWVIRRAWRPRKFSLRDTPGRPSRLTVLHVLGAFLVWQFAGEAARLLLRFTPLEEPHLLLLANVLRQAIGIAAVLLLAAGTFRRGLGGGMGLSLRHWVFDTLRGLYAMLAAFPLCIGSAMLVGWLLEQVRPEWVQPHSLLTALGAVSMPWKTLVVLSAVVLAPLVEELLFRGLLQSLLRKYLDHPWHAVLLTSAVFALFHLNTPQNTPALFLLSLVLGYNYERCGRLWAPILCHAVFNGIMILLHVL